jgi:hypothetical protein
MGKGCSPRDDARGGSVQRLELRVDGTASALLHRARVAAAKRKRAESG